MRSTIRSTVFLLVSLCASLPAAAQSGSCGMKYNDWCPAPAGDACGRHRNVDACKADASCRGVKFRGASVIACTTDARGFGVNCPTVGCQSAEKR